MQHTSHLLMIRPTRFDYNEATAVNNHFQVRSGDEAVQEKAQQEFETFISKLQSKGIDVTVVNDSTDPHTPDSIFPNNWVSFHEDGSLLLYPMFAENRRLERKPAVIDAIKEKFRVSDMIDLSYYEQEEHFLEGTGSMVLDRDNKIAYACLSPRTDKAIVDVFCIRMGYRSVTFYAIDARGNAIYHTNVMMCIADKYAVICLDSIADAMERDEVATAIAASGKEIIRISQQQVDRFAGNMLQVNNAAGEVFLVMSTQAFESLDPAQVKKIESFNSIIHSDIATIERNGGGSARCMMAEVFLPVK